MAQKAMKKNKQFYLSVICTFIDGVLSGSNFVLLYAAFSELEQGRMNMQVIWLYTIILIGVFTLRLIIYTYGYVQGQYGGAAVSRNIRIMLGEKLKRIPLGRFTQGQVGSYINVTTSDVNSYENILTHKTGDLIKNIALLVVVIIFAMVMYIPAGVVVSAAAVLLVPAIIGSFAGVKKYGNMKNDICADAVSSIVEYINGIQVFRAYGMAGTRNKTVTNDLKKYSDISYHYEKKIIPIGVVLSILSWFSLPLTIWISAGPWISGQISTVTYLVLCCVPLFLVRLIGVIFIDATSYRNMAISQQRIEGVFDEPEENCSAAVFVPKDYNIRFDQVKFAYVPGEAVLDNMSFAAAAGTLTAIVGDSGAGKSTILNLLSKYYEPEAGNIVIGGCPLKQLSAEQVLEQLSIVDQEVFLFNDTIRNNIRYADPAAADQDVEAACRAANCDDFIRRLEQGYDTIIGENGNQLSGGERQRLSIARAILKNSPILLLDEATASLDIENELAVKQAIVNLLRQEKTVIMIAHTLSIVRNADQILVIGDGKVLESGTHEELIERGGKYRVMWAAEEKLTL